MLSLHFDSAVNIRTLVGAAVLSAAAVLGSTGLVHANEKVSLVNHSSSNVSVDNIKAYVGNMYCGRGRNQPFTLAPGQAVECSFTHTHNVTQVGFFLDSPGHDTCSVGVGRDGASGFKLNGTGACGWVTGFGLGDRTLTMRD